MTLRAVEEIDRNPNLNLPQIRRCRRRQPPPTQRRHDDPSTKVTRKERRMESSGSLGRMFTTRRRYGTNRRLGGSMFRFSVVVLLLLTTDSVSSLANETLADSSTLSPSNQTYSIAQRPVLEISQAEPEGFLAEAYWHLHHLYVRRRLKQLYTRFVSIIKQVPWKWVIHLLVFLWHGYQPLRSIHTDTWQAERDPDHVYGRSTRITQHSHRRIVKRRVRQAQTIRRLVGAGYTPRLVWLFGVMLRGIIHCTPLPSIFQPPLGWGAGCVVAGKFHTNRRVR